MLVSMLTVMAMPVTAAATETLVTNHFDFSKSTNCVLNGSVGTAGGTKANNYFYTSDHIAVTAGETIYFGPARVKQGYQLYTYDANKNIVATSLGGSAMTVQETLIGASTADNNNDDIVIYKYTVPANVAYVRISTEAVFSRYFVMTRGEVLTQTALMRYLTAKNPLAASDNLFDLSVAAQGRMAADSQTPVSTSEYYSTKLIDVAVNDTVYFGPVNLNQGYQAVFFAGTAATGTNVGLRTDYDYSRGEGNLKVVDTFGSGQAILAYRANQAGKLSVVLPILYADYYMVTKNKPFSAQALYNYEDAQAGNNCYFRELDAKGALGTNGAYSATHYTSHAIKVNAGDKIVFGPASEGQGYQMITADINFGNLKKVDKNGLTNLGTLSTFSSYSYNPYVLYEYTVPEGVSYVYTVNRPTVKEYFITLKNSDVNTVAEYYAYTGVNPNGNTVGKTALFVGDSICAASADMKLLTSTTNSFSGFANTNYNNYKMTGWAPRVAYWNQFASFVNNGVGGASISDVRLGGAGTVTQQLEKTAGQKFDYVILHGGINDADTKTAAGTVTEGYDPANFDTSTFAGGLENTFYTAAKLYGDSAAIGYVFSYALPEAKRPHANVYMEEYFTVVQQACAKWGIAYLDLFHNEQVRADLKLSVPGAPELPDQLHVSTKGYNIISPYISSFVGTLTPYAGEDNDSAWAAMAEVLKIKAEELDAKYFTADSHKAFIDAVEAVTVTGKDAYEALLAAGDLLEQSETPLPFALANGGNAYYEQFFTTAGLFGVGTAEDFAAFAGWANAKKLNAGATVKQTADINLKAYANLMINSFAATYDGGNHSIYGYSLTGTGNYVAMFSALSGTIKNLTVDGAVVSGAWASAVLVASTTGTTALLENVHIKNSRYTKTASNGGALLLAQPNTDNDSYTIRNCSVTNNMMTIMNAAGNVGLLVSRGRTALSTIEGCVATGNEVYAKVALAHAGVIGGEFEAGTVKDCVAVGNTFYVPEFGSALFGRTKKGTINVSDILTDATVVSGGTSEQPAATINTSDLTVVPVLPVTENLYNENGIEVKAGETLFFGPVKEGEANLLFNGASAAPAYTSGRFGSGQVIYAYTAAENGTVTFSKVEYPEYFVVAKDQIMTVRAYYDYVDSLQGANLFNADLDYIQLFRNDGMVLSATKTHSSSHMIKVTPGETISFGPAVPNQGYQGVTFTADGLPVKTIKADNYPNNLSAVTLPSGLVLYNFVIPEGVGYLELIDSTTMNTLYYAKRGAMTEADYNAYIGLDPGFNPLYGKNALFVGDSITHATQDAAASGFNTTGKTGWAIRVAAANGMKYMNGGVSGASLSTVRGTNRIVNQLETYKDNDYDYVVIHGGVNDAWDNAPVGTISSSFDPATFNTATYAGGLEEAIYTAIKYYGDKATIFHLINFESPMHAKACDSGMYFEVGRKICDKWGIPYLDLASNKTLSNALDIYTSGGAFVTDNIHPQPAGYDVIYPYVQEYMKNLDTFYPAATKMNQKIAAQVAAVDAKYFTDDSYAAFVAAVQAAGTDTAALVAAAELLVPKTEIPLNLGNGNSFYFAALKKQKTFTVANGADFAVLANLSAVVALGSDVTVTQTADIDLSGFTNTVVGPTNAYAFCGVYNGQGFAIKNALLNNRADNQALFAYMGGTLKNLVIENATVDAGGWSAVGVSRVKGASLVENITVKNSTVIKNKNNGIAVLVCQGAGAGDKVTVKNCVVSGCTVKSTMGAFANLGLIVSRGQAGGLLVENCYAFNNTIECVSHNAGMIVAEYETGNVIGCGSFGNTVAEGTKLIGGIVAQAKIGQVYLDDCYTDMANVLGTAEHDEGNATPFIHNCAPNISAEQIASGEAAYIMKLLTGKAWAQNGYPTLTAGKAVQKVDYVVGNETVYTTYTDAEGKLIAPFTEEVEGLKEWAETVAENGDITYTAVLGHQNDLDGDGDLTTADVTYLLQYLVGRDLEVETSAADLSGDGIVSIYDAVLLLRMLAE